MGEEMNCDQCGGPTFTDDQRAERICSGCFTVVQSGIIDYAPVTMREDEYLGPGGPHHGPAIGLNSGTSLMTPLRVERRDARGHVINRETAQHINYLSVVDGWVINRRDRASKRLYAIVSSQCTKLRLPESVRNRTFYITKRAMDRNVLRGWETSIVVAGAIHLALREAKHFMPMPRIMTVIHSSRPKAEKQVMKAYIKLNRALEIRPVRMTASEILPFVINDLGLPRDVQIVADGILKNMTVSERPALDVAMAVYVACVQEDVLVSQRRIAVSCGTTDVSLRGRVREYCPEFVLTKPSNTVGVI